MSIASTRVLFSVFIVLFSLGARSAFGQYSVPNSNHYDFCFNYDWLFLKSNPGTTAAGVGYSETTWSPVSLPHTWSDDRFREWVFDSNATQADPLRPGGSYVGIAWYRKHFTLPTTYSNSEIILEFQGITYVGTFFVNGVQVGLNESGFGPSGVDITPYVKFGSDNVIAVEVDNNNLYQTTGYNGDTLPAGPPFNVNMGGINRDVTLHITDKAHLTQPLYRNLGTQGTYIFPTNINTLTKACTLNVQAEVKNDYTTAQTITCNSTVVDQTGTVVATIAEGSETIAAGQTFIYDGTASMTGVHFWDPTYPYLYKVYTQLTLNGQVVDVDPVTTGIRTYVFNPEFGFEVNGHYLYLNGYAPRASMEWPAVGTPVDWMNDYDFAQMRQTNGNFCRPMQCSPTLEQVQAADRYGIIMVVPSAYTEDDQTDPNKWQEDLDIMRDNTIYFRNDPSVEFYEACNGEPTAQHMTDMLNIRKQWDPSGGRLAGARTNDTDTTQGIREYSGTMDGAETQLSTPLFDCEYARAEQPRRVWDEVTPMYNPAWNGVNNSLTPFNGINTTSKYLTGGYFNISSLYHQNFGFYGANQMTPFNSTVATGYGQGDFIGEYLTPIPQSDGSYVGAYFRVNSAEDMVLENLGKYYARLAKSYAYQSAVTSATKGVNCGGAKIIWSDSWTDGRMHDMEVSRTSGMVDGVRLPKEVYYGMQVAQNSNPEVYVVGHWNYPAGTVKTMYVCSNTPITSLKTYDTSGNLLHDYTSVGTKNIFPTSILPTGSDQVNGFVVAFPNVAYQPGSIVAQGLAANGTTVLSTSTKATAGAPNHIVVTPTVGPSGGWLADGSDVAWFDVEVVDSNGNRCPTYQDNLTFSCSGQGQFLGGYNSGVRYSTNLGNITSGYNLLVESGINRVFVRSTRTAGAFTLTVNGTNNTSNTSFPTATATVTSQAVADTNGLSTVWPQKTGADLSTLTEPAPVAEGQAPPLVTQVPVAPSTDVTDYQYTGGNSGSTIIENVQAGQQAYVDEPWTLPTLPTYLQGAEFIQPYQSDAGDTSATDQYGFNLSKFSYIYVVIDAANNMPNNDSNSTYQWQKMPDTLTINGRVMNIFRSRLMEAHENALLADNVYENQRFSSGSNMYLVFVQNVEQQLVQPTDPITATSTQGTNVATEAIDGNTATRWNAADGTFPQTITLDLGQEMAIGGYTINWYGNATRYAQYKVSVSNDNVNFSTSLDMSLNQLEGVNEFLVPSTGAFLGRYVQISCENMSSGGWAAISEIQISGVPASLLPTNSSLLSFGEPATASSSAANQPASMANDNTTTTYWQASSTTYPQTWTVNLGQVQALTNVDTTWLSGSNQAYHYSIAVSSDGTHYTTVANDATNTMVGQTEDNFNAVGQYVQVTITGSSVSGVAAGAYEIQVSGAPVQTPLITSPLVVSTDASVAFSYTIGANYDASSFTATGLPSGLTLNTTTGVISGTPGSTSVGTYSITISATNSAGTFTTMMQLTITPPPFPPVVSSGTSASITVAKTYTSLYQITGTNYPTSYAATGLPTGLLLNATTGVISGTAIATGTYTIGVTAIDPYGTSATVNVNLSVVAGTDTNLALNKTATASSNYSATANLPPATVDGNTSTRWESAHSDPQWLEVDLGQVQTIHTIIIDWQDAAGKNYNLQGSTDGTTWTDIVTPITGNTVKAVVAYSGLHASDRYVRMYGTARTTAYGYSIMEFQVWGVTGSSGSEPIIDTPLSATGTSGVGFNFQIAATNNPTSYTATALPAGLTLNSTTGVISGTPATVSAPTATSVTVTATNATGTSPATPITITIDPTAPVITSALTADGVVNAAFSYRIVASNSPTSYSATTLLPSGLSLNTATGVISGTPQATGSTNVSISATNATGTGPTATLVINITAGVPVINSANTATGTVGVAFVYDTTSTPAATSFGLVGILPGGLILNTATGQITGTPTKAGSDTVVLNATNANGTSGPFTFTVTIGAAASNPPILSGMSSWAGEVGTAFSYTTAATNSPTSYAETGALPTGLTFSTSTGAISGTPTAAGTKTVSITATNSSGTSSPLSVAITIFASGSNPPAIVSATTATGTAGSAFSYATSATNSPTSYAETGALPTGLTFSTTTGAITGTPSVAGTSTVSITATNASGTSSASNLVVTIYAAGVTPTVTSPTSAGAAVGSAFVYQTTASDAPTSYAESGTLPAGLTFSTTTGTITGSPTAAGSSTISLTATNSHGASTPVNLVITATAATTDTNVGLNQTATGSSFEAGNGFASANDGSTTTRWAASTGAVPQYWEVNLGASKTLSRLDINWYTNATRYSQYTILTSNDGLNWTTQVDKSANVTDGATSDTFATPVKAQYVIVNASFTSSGYVSAFEIGVYGH